MKMCAIGDYDSICCFAALGIDIYEATDRADVEEIMNKSIKNNYGIVLITESREYNAGEIAESFKVEKIPAIIPIPSVTGEYNIGMTGLKAAVKKAVGSAEMIFGENN